MIKLNEDQTVILLENIDKEDENIFPLFEITNYTIFFAFMREFDKFISYCLDQKFKFSQQILYIAICFGDFQKFKLCLSNGCKIDDQAINIMFCLENFEMVEYLCDNNIAISNDNISSMIFKLDYGFHYFANKNIFYNENNFYNFLMNNLRSQETVTDKIYNNFYEKIKCETKNNNKKAEKIMNLLIANKIKMEDDILYYATKNYINLNYNNNDEYYNYIYKICNTAYRNKTGHNYRMKEIKKYIKCKKSFHKDFFDILIHNCIYTYWARKYTLKAIIELLDIKEVKNMLNSDIIKDLVKLDNKDINNQIAKITDITELLDIGEAKNKANFDIVENLVKSKK